MNDDKIIFERNLNNTKMRCIWGDMVSEYIPVSNGNVELVKAQQLLSIVFKRFSIKNPRDIVNSIIEKYRLDKFGYDEYLMEYGLRDIFEEYGVKNRTNADILVLPLYTFMKNNSIEIMFNNGESMVREFKNGGSVLKIKNFLGMCILKNSQDKEMEDFLIKESILDE